MQPLLPGKSCRPAASGQIAWFMAPVSGARLGFDRWDWRWVLAASAAMLAVCLAAQWLRPVWLARAGLWAGWFLAAWGLTGARWNTAAPEQFRPPRRSDARESVELQGRIAGQPVLSRQGAFRRRGGAGDYGSSILIYRISAGCRIGNRRAKRVRVLAGARKPAAAGGSHGAGGPR